jgi:endonuclease/exonuclease/phosphatase (EEP) superfamily protein YafD
VVVVGVLAWAAIALMAFIVATQLAGWSHTSAVVTLQAATPYVLALSIPIGVVAAIAGSWPLALAATPMAVALVVMSRPLRRAPTTRRPQSAEPRVLRVFHGNLLYYNGRAADLARVVAGLDADVLAFTEYTPTHAGGLYVSPLGADYPHRIEHPESTAGGSALWSRYPITEVAAPRAFYRSSAAVVDAEGGVTVYVVHPPNPLENIRPWRDEIHGLARSLAVNGPPSIIVGDFNATYWHPPFRRLLEAGWRDAHVLAGRGFSSSWPNDKRWVPPFLRLDHALVSEALVVTETVDVDLPGSDHRGLVVSVIVSRVEAEG